ncbi:class I SAM-dependent RNA methyltransferase [Sandaracinobacteroides hominis]|uniref:class I SAM-dependent RNA methyltransferase n=1 Tax=Sandaracinobacteroides hominis TaxID=2780086 RepID=UPI0018F794B6|nr:class I SAM-dependent RNA methyltransferase [Sandaracinobacteroides hominis]
MPEIATIVRLAARGDGVTADGRYIARAVPGDGVDEDGAILPGPNHQQPACRHFGACGGCQLQHVPDALIAEFARDRILHPLERAGIVPTEVMPVHVSPAHSRRRAAMRATRTKGQVRVGFNAEGAHSLVDIAECPVLRPELFELVAPLRQILGPHLAERSAIGITMTLTDQGVDLLLSNLQANSLPVIEGLTGFARETGLARLSLEGPMGVETLVERAEPSIRMGGVTVTLAPAAFLQATADGEAALVEAVTLIVGSAGQLADLFAGSGTFALPLSRTAAVTAADGAGPAIRALAEAARRAGRALVTQHRDLFRKPLPADELGKFDAVVIDPPRAGAIAQMGELAQSKVPVIAAVSCNPATFARDAECLVAGGYTLHRLWPVAQFRWSTHIELVAEFRR